MRLFLILIFSFFLVAVVKAPAQGAFNIGTPVKAHAQPRAGNLNRYDASILYWFVSGNFKMEGGPPAAANRWSIEHPTDGKALLFDTELRLSPRVTYDLALGIGVVDDGRVTDTDIDAAGIVSDLSFSTGQGRWSLFGANVYVTAYRTRSVLIDLFAGYLYMNSSMDYRDPNIKISNYISTNLSWQERWLNYDLVHHGVRLGARGEVRVNNLFSVKAEAGIIPWLKADYDGLRYPERPLAQQQIEAIEADGLGVDATISAEFSPYREFVFLLGYRYQSFKTDGRDKAGTLWAGSWEEFTLEYKGPFAGLSFIY